MRIHEDQVYPHMSDKYEAAVKAREARRNQANTEIKEMRFRLKIDEHDYETKKGHVVRFLKGGDKVKVTIMFRGREQSRPEMGRRLLLKLADEVAEFAIVENLPSQEGRNMSLVLGPLKKKAEAKEELRKAREAKKKAEDADREPAKVAPKKAAPQAKPVEEKATEAPKAEVVEVVEAPEAEVVEVVEAPVAEAVEAPKAKPVKPKAPKAPTAKPVKPKAPKAPKADVVEAPEVTADSEA